MLDPRTRLGAARLYLCTDARRSSGDLPEFLDAADHVFADHADRVAEALEDHVGTIMARKQMALAAD